MNIFVENYNGRLNIVKKKNNFNGLETNCEERIKILDGLPSLVN